MADRSEDSERTRGTTISRVEEDIHIDPTSACRSICVKGIPEGTTAEELTIHFQRKKNGGGDVDTIVMNKRGTAVITFDNPEGKTSVAKIALLFVNKK